MALLKFLLPAVQRIPDRLERLAVAHDLAGYIGVSDGAVLESFRKSAADRQEKTIERPREPVRADERRLLTALLAENGGREALLADLGGHRGSQPPGHAADLPGRPGDGGRGRAGRVRFCQRAAGGGRPEACWRRSCSPRRRSSTRSRRSTGGTVWRVSSGRRNSSAARS